MQDFTVENEAGELGERQTVKGFVNHVKEQRLKAAR